MDLAKQIWPDVVSGQIARLTSTVCLCAGWHSRSWAVHRSTHSSSERPENRKPKQKNSCEGRLLSTAHICWRSGRHGLHGRPSSTACTASRCFLGHTQKSNTLEFWHMAARLVLEHTHPLPMIVTSSCMSAVTVSKGRYHLLPGCEGLGGRVGEIRSLAPSVQQMLCPSGPDGRA